MTENSQGIVIPKLLCQQIGHEDQGKTQLEAVSINN